MRNIQTLMLLAVLSSGTVNATSLGEISSLQGELEKAELQNKIDKTRKAETMSVMPAQTVMSQREPAVTLVGVYGIGRKLHAIVSVDGAEIAFSEGDSYIGYRAISVLPHEAILARLDGKGREIKGKILRLHLTAAPDGPMHGFPSLPGVPGANQGMPPNMAMPPMVPRQ